MNLKQLFFCKYDKKPCEMCDSARVNSKLDKYDDYSIHSIGSTSHRLRRFVLCSGRGEPVRINYEMYDVEVSRWRLYGTYYPKYCPNCGRRLFEYFIQDRGRGYFHPEMLRKE